MSVKTDKVIIAAEVAGRKINLEAFRRPIINSSIEVISIGMV